jgi:hypothetical protein
MLDRTHAEGNSPETGKGSGFQLAYLFTIFPLYLLQKFRPLQQKIETFRSPRSNFQALQGLAQSNIV